MISTKAAPPAGQDTFDLDPSSPLCPPDWRFRLGLRLAGRGKADRFTRPVLDADPYLGDVVEFLRLSENRRDEDNQWLILNHFPNIAQAHNLHHHPNKHAAQTLRARVVAGQEPESIAARMCARPEVVGWYERLFWDVRGRLGQHDYVLNVVLGEKHHTTMTERDTDVLWNFIAFVGGPVALDAVLRKSYNVIRPHRVEDINQFVKDSTKAMINLRALVATRTLQLSPLTQIPLIELWQTLSIADQASGADSGVSAVLKVVGDALTKLPHASGKNATQISISLLPQVNAKPVMRLPGDLRADELMIAAATGELPEGIDKLDFPPTPGRKKDDSHLFADSPRDGD